MSSTMKIATCCEENSVLLNASFSFYGRDRKHRYGITSKKDFVSWNGSSGACAINLAYHMGAKTIVLLGFDMRRVDGEKNWHSDHKEHIKADPFLRHLKAFPAIKKDALTLGLTVLNATPESAINAFPFVSIEEVL